MTKSQAGQTSEKKLPPQPAMVPIYLGLTWLCPGLGHVLMGDVRRGLILGITIWGLFLSGLLIGGVGVVDSKLNRAWFLGQQMGKDAMAAIESAKKIKELRDRSVELETYAEPDQTFSSSRTLS